MRALQRNKALDHLVLPASIVRAHVRHFYYGVLWGRYRPDPKKVVWVKTADINLKKEPIFNGARRLGTNVAGGDWDLCVRSDVVDYDHAGPTIEGLIRIEEFQLYKAIEQMIHNGIEWEETGVYRNRLRTRVRSLEKLAAEGKKIKGLIASIRENGLIPQSILRAGRSRLREALLPAVYGEIRVAIGRSGEIFLEDGVHRFFIARALGIEKIPVRVILRHERWQEIRSELMRRNRDDALSGSAAFGNHPDIKPLPG